MWRAVRRDLVTEQVKHVGASASGFHLVGKIHVEKRKMVFRSTFSNAKVLPPANIAVGVDSRVGLEFEQSLRDHIRPRDLKKTARRERRFGTIHVISTERHGKLQRSAAPTVGGAYVHPVNLPLGVGQQQATITTSRVSIVADKLTSRSRVRNWSVTELVDVLSVRSDRGKLLIYGVSD
jgi:hypothetical protein